MLRPLEEMDDEGEDIFLLPLLIELSDLLEEPPPEMSKRLRFALTQKARVKSAYLENQRVDLVRLARFIIEKMMKAQVYGKSI